MTGASRPQGITILAVLAFVGGFFGVTGGLAVIGFGGILGAAFGTGPLFTVLGLVALVLGVAELAIGYGFWTLKPWAWSFAFIVFAIYVILDVVRLVTNSGGGFTSVLISLAITAVVVYYMHQPGIRQAFGAPTAGFPIVGTALDKYIPTGR